MQQHSNVPLIFEKDSYGNKYCLADDRGMTHFYAVVSPEITGDLAAGDTMAQTASVIKQLDVLLQKHGFKAGAVHQTIFLREIGEKQLVRQMMLDYFGDQFPIINYVAQKPFEGAALLVELHAIKSSGTNLVIHRREEHVVQVTYADVAFTYVGDLTSTPEPIGSYARSYSTFGEMKKYLEKYDFKMADILRTWIYQGHIVLPEGDTQRYKELNRARTVFFEGIEFIKDLLPEIPLGDIYPASTGIGAQDVDVEMACVAIQTQRTDVVAVPLENPDQTPAFDYGAVYSPQSPKFSRAMALAFDGHCTIYVSGTASITDSETRFIGDPAGQTEQTLDNIEALIAGSNVAKHGIEGFDADLKELVSARVYVKCPEYYEAIRAVCERRFGDTPIIYSLGDVCRDDLLVEIEGIAICRGVAPCRCCATCD